MTISGISIRSTLQRETKKIAAKCLWKTWTRVSVWTRLTGSKLLILTWILIFFYNFFSLADSVLLTHSVSNGTMSFLLVGIRNRGHRKRLPVWRNSSRHRTSFPGQLWPISWEHSELLGSASKSTKATFIQVPGEHSPFFWNFSVFISFATTFFQQSFTIFQSLQKFWYRL